MRYYIATISLALLIFTGCSSTPSCIVIAPPSIHLTGEKTSVEKQMVGEYQELEKDAWVVSSVKTGVSQQEEKAVEDATDRELLKALKIRQLNEDTINAYKDEGAMGETAQGLLTYRTTDTYESSPFKKEELLRILRVENQARTVVFQRSVSVEKGESRQEKIQEYARNFASEQRALASEGHWIQQPGGEWTRK